jgi:hypothetical protein
VSITGTFNSSSVVQGANAGSGIGPSTGATGGENNQATVLLRGNNLSSTIVQGGAFNAGLATNLPSAGNNVATVDLASEAASSNNAAVANQISSIRQESRGNTARVLIRGGRGSATAADNDPNTATVTQRNTQFQSDAAGTGFQSGTPNATNNPTSNNTVDLSINGFGQQVIVTQDGVQNFTSASVNRGGTGTAGAAGQTQFEGLSFPIGRRAGNDLNVSQSGRNMTALVSVGGRDAENRQGRGNQLAITQRGVVDALTGLPTGAAGDEGRGHSATVYQFGQLGRIGITQQNNTASTAQTTGNPGGQQFGSVADVSQSAFASTVTLTQRGTNSAFLSQGGGSADVGANTSGNNQLVVDQTDAGDNPGGSSTDPDPFGGTDTGQGQPFSNVVIASQAGRFNVSVVNQNASNASASIFQRRGSSSATVSINQGMNAGFGSGAVTGTAAGGARDVTADVDQGGTGRIDIRQDGRDLRARVNQNNVEFSTNTTAIPADQGVVQISQVGRNNSALVNQTGTFSTATVDQRFNNGTSSASFRNVVQIDQTGGNRADRANIATARQGTGGTISGISAVGSPASGSGVAGDTADNRAAGQRSAEIRISQTHPGTGVGVNSATVEQRGAGQYGEITQNGRDNTAGILQTDTATNAVAIIRQNGDGNTFFIQQERPGQFFRVVQSGGNNNVITSTGLENAGSTTPGGTGGTTVPVFTTSP